MGDKRVLYIVEDDCDIRDLVVYAFRNAGFECGAFPDGAALFGSIDGGTGAPPDILLLDIMLPGEDGISILKSVKSRADTRGLPVIIITAKGSEADKVRGLDVGADDYVTKPFGVMELIARVNAVLRRARPAGADGGVLEYNGITLDVKKREVAAGGAAVGLTYTEFEILRYMMVNVGIVLTRDMIMDAVWGADFYGESRAVDMHVKSLRKKLGERGGLIKTIRGAGYKMCE